MVKALAKIHKAEKLLTCGALAEQILHPPPPPCGTQTNFWGVVYLRSAEHLVLFEPKCLGSRAGGLPPPSCSCHRRGHLLPSGSTCSQRGAELCDVLRTCSACTSSKPESLVPETHCCEGKEQIPLLASSCAGFRF